MILFITTYKMDFNAIDMKNGDCKEIGIAWSPEEAYAVRNLGIPAEMVREGILTQEAYDKKMGTKSKKTSKKDADVTEDDSDADDKESDNDQDDDTTDLEDSTTTLSPEQRDEALKTDAKVTAPAKKAAVKKK